MFRSCFIALQLFFSFSIEGHAVHYNSKYKTFTEAAKHEDGLCVITFFAEVKNQTLFVC